MNPSFRLKHWFYTLVLGSLLPMLVLPILHGNGFHPLEFFDGGVLIIFIAIFLSLPAATLYFIAAWFVGNSPLSKPVKKLVLIMLALLGILLTFTTIAEYADSMWPWYTLASVVTGIAIPLERKPTPGDKQAPIATETTNT